MSDPKAPGFATKGAGAGRVAYIEREMRELRWQRGVTRHRLAKEWGLSVSVVSKYASFASKRIRAEIDNPERVTETVGVALNTAIRRALSLGEHMAVAKLAQVWCQINGIGAKRSGLPESPAQSLPEDPAERLAILRALRKRVDRDIAESERALAPAAGRRADA